jgi:hypothetical protein
MRSSLVRLALATALFTGMTACGGGDGDGPTNPPSPPPPPPPPGPAAVASVTISGTVPPLVAGDEVQLTATAHDVAGAELTDRAITWSSSNEAVATVSQTGLVTAVTLGNANITATSEQRSGSKAIQVLEGARIGVDGGTVTGLEGAARLEIPAGALTAPVSITLTRATSLPLDPSAVSNSGYVLGPAGTSLIAAATLTLSYAPEGMPSGVPEQHLQVHRLNSGNPEGLGGEVDAEANTATAEVTGLGTFLVRRAPPGNPCTAPEYDQFDFWVGRWQVKVAAAPPGAPPAPSDITKEAGGCAVFENFGNGSGRSINVYNPATGDWHQTYLFSNNQRLILVGGRVGSDMVLSRELPGTPGSFDRWIWSPLSEGRVRQFNEVSTDGGATVHIGFDGTYSPR